MIRTMNLKTRREILSNIHNQYQESNWLDKAKFLYGFIAASGYDRKYTIKLLNSTEVIKKYHRHTRLEANMTSKLSRR
jgi:hypothetical protein